MARTQAGIAVGIVVFGFDVEPGASSSRALQVLTSRRALPKGEVAPRERLADAALRLATECGVDLGGRRIRGDRLH
nr:hypothetical protein [Candidatus Dormibacteraeota bacterium]